MKRVAACAALLGCLLAVPAHSAGLSGIWLTPPDQKAQTGHVQITPCGGAMCGTVISAFDKTGRPIRTAAVGKRVLWDVTGSGGRHSGKVYVPLMNSAFPVTLTENGNRLDLRACNAVGICRNQTWQRVK